MNPTLALTLILLTLMAGAGAVSASLGYNLGREALKGITQPDLRPTAVGEGGQKPRRETMVIVPESKTISEMEKRLRGGAQAPESSPVAAPAATPSPSSDFVAVAPQAGFPLLGQSQGMTLSVDSVQRQGDAVVLNVSLKNTSGRPVQFLYSALNLSDNQGRTFSANTQGLPAEVPPNGESFSGTVSIPSALVQESQTLSLSLENYPDQQIQLQVSNIPLAGQ